MERRRVYRIVEGSRTGNTAGRWLDAALIVLVILSVGAALLETVEAVAARYGALLAAVEGVCGIAFTVEYLVRLWACTEDRLARYKHPLRGRLRYASTPLALIDLLAALPYWLALVSPMSVAELWLFRVVRVLKLLRFSSALDIFGTVLRTEWRSLTTALTIVTVLTVLLPSVMYLVERDAQPDKFGSVPDAMWWGIVTLATVGYGDVVPVTPLGRLLGGLTVLLGLAMFALPAGIIASGFVEEARRRNFVVTWNLVASVPFFESLPAARIAEIAGVLIPQVATKGEILVQKGELADCMYFIVSGEVEVQLEPRTVRLHTDDFFGEIALLTDSPRSATVVAMTATRLLVLRVADFRKIMAAHADLRDAISRVAAERLAGPAVAAPG